MAVGKGSMERAAKAAEKTAASENVTADNAATAGRKTKTAKKAAPAKKKADNTVMMAETVAAAETIAAPTEEVMQQIVYQKSSGMLERAAKPNERFGLGDEMPVYYF